MSYKYNKKKAKIDAKLRECYNRYWQNVSRKMRRKCFLYCTVLKRETFCMKFEHNTGIEYDRSTLKFYGIDFVKDNEILIEHYARINDLEIADEKLTGTKSIYWFKKVDVSKF